MAPLLCSNGHVVVRHSPIFVALAYFAGGTVLYLLDLGVVVDDRPARPPWVWTVVLGCACAPIVFRRTRPLLGLALGTVVLVVDLTIGPSIPVWLAYTDLLYAAALFGSALTSRILERAPLLLIAAVSIGVGVYLGDVRVAVWAAALGALLILVPVWWARSVRAHRDAADLERARSQAVKRVAELDRHAALTSERQRLARDLHDVVAGHLSSIAIQSEAALRVRTTDPERALTVLESVRADSVAALNEMQSMVTLLRADDTGDAVTTAGRLRDLPALVDSAAAAGTTVEITGTVPGDLEPEVDLTAYRILRETLTNAVKHASGQTVSITILEEDGLLTIEAANPVMGTVEQGHGHGVRNIAERASAVGGYARSAREGEQWRVCVRLPAKRRHGQ